MLKTPEFKGHSSKVRGWLIVQGQQHELAQVGPGFCILRESIVSDQVPAELIIEIDGDQRTKCVHLLGTDGTSQRRISFTAVPVTSSK